MEELRRRERRAREKKRRSLQVLGYQFYCTSCLRPGPLHSLSSSITLRRLVAPWSRGLPAALRVPVCLRRLLAPFPRWSPWHRCVPVSSRGLHAPGVSMSSRRLYAPRVLVSSPYPLSTWRHHDHVSSWPLRSILCVMGVYSLLHVDTVGISGKLCYQQQHRRHCGFVFVSCKRVGLGSTSYQVCMYVP